MPQERIKRLEQCEFTRIAQSIADDDSKWEDEGSTSDGTQLCSCGVCGAAVPYYRRLLHAEWHLRNGEVPLTEAHESSAGELREDMLALGMNATQIDFAIERIARAEAENARLRKALEDAAEHLEDMRSAFERGALSDHEGKIGPRSNRNYSVLVNVRAALKGEPTS